VNAEGIESANERKFNNMQGQGCHLRPRKVVLNQNTDCGMDRNLRAESL